MRALPPSGGAERRGLLFSDMSDSGAAWQTRPSRAHQRRGLHPPAAFAALPFDHPPWFFSFLPWYGVAVRVETYFGNPALHEISRSGAPRASRRARGVTVNPGNGNEGKTRFLGEMDDAIASLVFSARRENVQVPSRRDTAVGRGACAEKSARCLPLVSQTVQAGESQAIASP